MISSLDIFFTRVSQTDREKKRAIPASFLLLWRIEWMMMTRKKKDKSSYTVVFFFGSVAMSNSHTVRCWAVAAKLEFSERKRRIDIFFCVAGGNSELINKVFR